jgi:hypothetical protein
MVHSGGSVWRSTSPVERANKTLVPSLHGCIACKTHCVCVALTAYGRMHFVKWLVDLSCISRGFYVSHHTHFFRSLHRIRFGSESYNGGHELQTLYERASGRSLGLSIPLHSRRVWGKTEIYSSLSDFCYDRMSLSSEHEYLKDMYVPDVTRRSLTYGSPF